jgi:hypothetical protein
MSLPNNQDQEMEEMEELMYPSEVRAMVAREQKEKTKQVQKLHRDRYMATWQQEKQVIDNLLGKAELRRYIKSTQDKASDPRVGLHSMKINPHELALIRLCLEITGAKSSRELFIKFCKQAVKGK